MLPHSSISSRVRPPLCPLQLNNHKTFIVRLAGKRLIPEKLSRKLFRGIIEAVTADNTS